MAFTAPVQTSEFTLPPAGLHSAVCCDVVDLGMIETSFGPKHKLFISWLINVTDDEGRPLIASKRYTVSMHEKSNLYRDMSTWFNMQFTDEQAAAFDFDKLPGRHCMIQIMHQDNNGKTYANVIAVMPHQNGMPIVEIGDYVRHINRPASDNPKDVRNPTFLHNQQPQNGHANQPPVAPPPTPQPVPQATQNDVPQVTHSEAFAGDDDLPF